MSQITANNARRLSRGDADGGIKPITAAGLLRQTNALSHSI